MQIVYRLGQASVQEVLDRIEDPPSYSAIRAHLKVLVEKGHLRHRWDGPRYSFEPSSGVSASCICRMISMLSRDRVPRSLSGSMSTAACHSAMASR